MWEWASGPIRYSEMLYLSGFKFCARTFSEIFRRYALSGKRRSPYLSVLSPSKVAIRVGFVYVYS
jgi:hypothetical protein